MASNPDISSALGSVPFFSGLDARLLKVIAQSGKEITYKAGRTIVKEGDMGVGFFLILGGKVEVRKGSKVLARLSRGQFFGEMALVDDAPRSADVVAVEDSPCFTLTSWNFNALVKLHPELAMPIMKELAKRLRKAQSNATA